MGSNNWAAVSALSLADTLYSDSDRNRTASGRPSSDHLSGPATSRPYIDQTHQRIRPVTIASAGRSSKPPEEQRTDGRSQASRRSSDRSAVAENRMPLHKVHSATSTRDERLSSYNGFNSTYSDFNVSRASLDDGTASISDASGSTGLSRHTSSVASVRSLDARSRPASQFSWPASQVSRPVSQASRPVSQAAPTSPTQFPSLAARIAYDERQKKLTGQLKRLQGEEQERVAAQKLAQLSVGDDHARTISRPNEQPSSSRRTSTVSSLPQDQDRRESNPEPQSEHSPEIEQRFGVDDLIQWENNDLRSPPPTYASHWNDLEEILNLEMMVQRKEATPIPQQNQKNASPALYQIPLPDMLELPNQWAEPLELLHVEPSYQMRPPDVLELPNQWTEPLELLHVEPERPPIPPVPELSPSTVSSSVTELSPSTVSASVAELPPSPPSPLLAARMHASSLPNLDECQELDGSVFADIDSFLANLPSRKKSAFKPAPSVPPKIAPEQLTRKPAPPIPPKIAPEPPLLPYPSITSVANDRKHWLSQASPGSLSRPHSHLPPRPSHAELPTPEISSLPYPTATADHTLFPASDPIPPPPPFTFELSSSNSVLHRARARGLHDRYRKARHHSDLAVYNTHTHDAYPLMEAEERFEMPARPYESDRRDLYTWDRDSYAPELVVQPDVDPITGRAWGT